VNASAKANRAHRESVAEIGPWSHEPDAERRESCRLDLHLFLISYFPQSAGLWPYSPAHRRVIERVQTCVLTGGQFAEAMPRGSGKTTITEGAAIWATAYGHRMFVVPFGASAQLAAAMIDSIKTEWETNDLLYEDFPEVAHAVRALEGKPQRCLSQTFSGEPTHIQWRADMVAYPVLTGRNDPSAGAVIVCKGLTAAFHGMKHKLPSGQSLRPSLILLDDPQTADSAARPAQVNKRLATIRSGIKRLGSHGRQIAVVMTANVMQPDDLVDQLADHTRNPSWQSERIAMICQFPTRHADLWMGEYRKLRETYDRDVIGDQTRAHEAATAYYREHRAEMDAGAEVFWEHCYDHDTELSALQHAYNLLIDDGAESFASQCQNQPLRVQEQGVAAMSIADVRGRANGRVRGAVPVDAIRVTAFADLHKDLLYWCVCAWREDFTGYVVDYGTWPEQHAGFSAMADASRPLHVAYPGMGEDGTLQAGLTDLVANLLSRRFPRGENTAMIERLHVDAGYKASIVAAVKHKIGGAAMHLQFGRGITAAKKPMSAYERKPGEEYGDHWYRPNVQASREFPHIAADVNYWKSRVRDALKTAPGDPGALTLFGTPSDHDHFARHVADSEYAVETFGYGRRLEEWRLRAGNSDNHWWDCLVGCAVAASASGIGGTGGRDEPARRKLRLSEVYGRRA
jgi:hypothetical protein